MAVDDVIIRMKTVGAKQAAKDVDGVASANKRLGSTAGKAAPALDDQAAATTSVGASARGSLKGLVRMGGAATGVLALGKGFSFAMSEAEEARRATAATASVIKSTGGAAGVTADHVSQLAGSISNKTGIDDEQIQSMQNLLLTFKNVRNGAAGTAQTFDLASQAAVDMASRFNMGPKQASIMLGKALNDPVKGITALGKAGVTFSAQQKSTIASMVKSGDTAGAQALILKELNSQVGGAAEANALPMDKLKVAAGNLAEKVGLGLVPVIDGFARGMLAILGGIGKVVAAVKFLMPALAGFGAAMIVYNARLIATNVLFAAWAVKYAVVNAATGALAAKTLVLNAVLMANPIGLVVAALVGLGVAFVMLWKRSETFRNGVKAVWSAIKTSVGGAISWIGNKITWLIDKFKGIGSGITDAVKGAADGIKNAFKSAINWIIEKWNSFELSIGPVKIPGLPDIPKVSVGTPNVPMLATGGQVSQGGWAVVGERGPELAKLPGGSTVYDAQQSAGAMAGGGGGTIDLNLVGGTAEVRAAAKIFLDLLTESAQYRAAHA